MKNKIILMAIAFLFISTASAWVNSTFNNSLQTENLSFVGNSNVTRYLQVPNSVNLLASGYMNLTGFVIGSKVANVSSTWALSGGTSNNDGAGWLINMTNAIIVYNVTRFSLATADQAFILNSSRGVIAVSTNTSNVFNFSTHLDAGKIYYIVVNRTTGVSETHYFSNSTPINFGDFKILNGTENSIPSVNISSVWDIQAIGYTNQTNSSVTIGGDNIGFAVTANGTVPVTVRTGNLATIISKYLNSSYLIGSDYIIPFSFHSDFTGTLQYSSMFFSDLGFSENSQTFNPNTVGGSKEQFLINITYDSTRYNSINPAFVYNNTVYVPTQIGTGNNLVFNATLTIPGVPVQIVKGFYWNFTLTDSVNTTSYLSSNQSQTINPLGIDNCSTNTNTLFNFSLLDEDTRTYLNGTIEVIINVFTPGTTNLITTFNQSLNYIAGKGNAEVCLSNITTGYAIDYEAKYYGNSSYAVEYKYAQKLAIDNNTGIQNINLYDILNSRDSVFQIILTAADLSTITNAVIDVQRQYVSVNQFISVESPLTDSNGQTVANLVAEEVVYNFIVSRQGVILGTFNNYNVKCANAGTGDCSISLNLIQSTANSNDYTNYGNISVLYTLDKTNRILSMAFVSTDGLAHTINQFVIKNDGYGNSTICANNAFGTSGTLTCSIPISYGNTSIISQLFSDGVPVGNAYFSLDSSPAQIFGGTRILLGMLMYSTLTLLFIASPIMIVLGSVVGLGFAIALHALDNGSFWGNGSIFLWFVIAAAIIIMRFNKEGS